jgi:threonine synthase
MDRLECQFCLKTYPLDLFRPFCPQCGEPMLVFYPRGTRTFAPEKNLSLERWRAFLPLDRISRRLSLGEGNTALVPLDRVGRKWGLPPLFAKNETMNPTQSFKDRGTAVAVQKAVSLGIQRIGTVSTGNMASSTAAYGARAGLRTYVLLKADTTPEKTRSTGVHGAVLVKVKGDYGELFSESYRIGAAHGIYFANSIDPLRIEGYKVTSFELFEQLGNRAPRFVFCPVSSGGHLIGLMQGFLHLQEQKYIRDMPVFVGVQAAGCSPLVRAFVKGSEKFRRVSRPQTIAHAISNAAPPGGNLVLKRIRENGGLLAAVTDQEILHAQRELAELEGIFADPASATVLAAIIKLSRRREIRLRGEAVLIITGSGLKSMETLELQNIGVRRSSIANLEKTLFSRGELLAAGRF